MAAYVDITDARQGVDWTMDPAPRVLDQNGNVIDITGWTAVLDICTANNLTATLLLSLTNLSGLVMGGPLGTIIPSATAAQLLAMSPGTFFYRLFATAPTGKVYDIIGGRFVLLATPTP